VLGTVHACIGAGVGSFTDKKSIAFVSGVLSHAIADALPHRDVDPAIDVPMIAGVLTGIACWKGLDSPEFWGALGGVSPDIEHGLELVGLIEKDQKIFPTHIDNGKWHGDESGTERWSQLILSVVSLALVALNSRD
jgi:hypothetical protein